METFVRTGSESPRHSHGFGGGGGGEQYIVTSCLDRSRFSSATKKHRDASRLHSAAAPNGFTNVLVLIAEVRWQTRREGWAYFVNFPLSSISTRSTDSPRANHRRKSLVWDRWIFFYGWETPNAHRWHKHRGERLLPCNTTCIYTETYKSCSSWNFCSNNLIQHRRSNLKSKLRFRR